MKNKKKAKAKEVFQEGERILYLALPRTVESTKKVDGERFYQLRGITGLIHESKILHENVTIVTNKS